MKNKVFEIETDILTGGVSSIILRGDKHRMNWCESKTSVWGTPYTLNRASFNRNVESKAIGFAEKPDSVEAEYSDGRINTSVRRYFNSSGRYCEEYVFRNISSLPVFLKMGDWGINTPFNDNYGTASECLTNKCHTHIWCGNNSSYVNAVRMGDRGKNICMVLTEGEFCGYAQNMPEYAKNDRGDFVMLLPPKSFEPGDTYKIGIELFDYSTPDELCSSLKGYPAYVDIKADNYTVFAGENISFSAESLSGEVIIERTDGADVDFNKDITGRYIGKTSACGEVTVWLSYGDHLRTKAVFNIIKPIDKIASSRAKFIVGNQQYFSPGSKLDGAYLLYDRIERSLYFNESVYDHNASRERIAMGILLAKYLQNNKKSRLYDSLMKYRDFVFREFFDPETGNVFDTVGRNKERIRLYNAPWVSMFLCELYELTGDKTYLTYSYRTLTAYYESDGDKFYPNAVLISQPVELMQGVAMNEEAKELLFYFRKHAENIIRNGENYPPHEVDYEQTIVAPAAMILLEVYKLTGEKRYLDESEKHMKLLDRFCGNQPDHHLCGISIRHWDDYWFGRSQTFGDTFPHYWSVLNGYAHYMRYRLTGEKTDLVYADMCIRNNLSLFMPDGFASCAYVYPDIVSGKRGKFFDDYANDQDFALYFALKYFESTEKDKGLLK